MDASSDDSEVLLHKSSPELIADLQRSLGAFLWKQKRSGNKHIRGNVRRKETDRLISLLEPFQELPQLLDPHLNTFLPILAEAFLACLLTSAPKPAPQSQLLFPTLRAICKLLYTFCKIRGEKVVVRFLSTETKYLELLLSALEENQKTTGESGGPPLWDWEERYITLLWLSQLLLAPFDLSTISSQDAEKAKPPAITGLNWPAATPVITFRVISLAIQYLASSGKERDAAKVLLVRMSMRRDMQEIGILSSLVQWSQSCLKSGTSEQYSAYLQIGILSFLAGLISSSTSTKLLQPFLVSIFETVEAISGTSSAYKALNGLAVARKSVIKVLRALSITVLQVPANVENQEIVESTISTLLEALADPATPVRLAASKSLSIITSKLDVDFAAQVIEAVLDSLRVNVTKSLGDSQTQADLSRVNPYEWHGLILTLSHFLYRRSPPVSSLPDILPALFLGLNFEQKSSTGATVGTNVRDAACFGLWALSRRYKTDELLNIQLEHHTAEKVAGLSHLASTLEQLGMVLVVSACLDPAGNIRRGSSAALQELIGRHPNTIENGIQVVQVVDYHAVALRSRAIKDVTTEVATLSSQYHYTLCDNLVGWRGVEDANAQVREDAASTFGILIWTKVHKLHTHDGRTQFGRAVTEVSQRLSRLALRQVELRHGLLLCLISLIDCMQPELVRPEAVAAVKEDISERAQLFLQVLDVVCTHLSRVEVDFTKTRKPELIAVVASRLISVAIPLVRKCSELQYKKVENLPQDDEIKQHPVERFLEHRSLQSGATHFMVQDVLDELASMYEENTLPNKEFVDVCLGLLRVLIPLNEDVSVSAVANAAADLMLLCSENTRELVYLEWIGALQSGVHLRDRKAYLFVLFQSFPILAARHNHIPSIISQVKTGWAKARAVEERIAILQALARLQDLITYLPDFFDIVVSGLEDYSTDARGDVGSWVRIDALKVVRNVWSERDDLNLGERERAILFGGLLRLAAEKLDKVRAAGQATLALLIEKDSSDFFCNLSTSLPQYFTFLLDLTHSPAHLMAKWTTGESGLEQPNVLSTLLAGYVTSADTGSEDLVRSSRTALAIYCESEENRVRVFNALSGIIKANEGDDRLVVPALEVLGFLGDFGAWNGVPLAELKLLYLRNQKAHYKTTNVKKLDAAIKIYGCIIEVLTPSSANATAVERNELKGKVVEKLVGMLAHPFPRVREKVVDELWVRCSVGKGLDVTKRGMGKVEAGELRNLLLS